ncbi:cytochrome P450 [Athelia psychrophila]|uniref:Cytochrome P450 n=1 Tax=Athelia psychrophila TaxID=1759441 RepID=A0A166DD01_9AGAM|nr:cytochrome P450 [Fibularhizoctonia sp. CBS 109695]
MILKLLLSALSTLVAFGVWKALAFAYRQLTTPLRQLPGPRSAHWFYGNFGQILAAENSVMHEQWFDEFGPTIKYDALLRAARLCTKDTRAVAHILNHSYTYQKPAQVKYTLGRMLGKGLLFVEEDQHKQQRKIMQPAFGPAQVRALTAIFTEKAVLLRDLWSAELAKSTDISTTPASGAGAGVRLDALAWLSKMTLDVIGEAGFNYRFNALKSEGNELNEAFKTMFGAAQALSPLPVLQAYIPLLRLIPSDRERRITVAQDTMGVIGRSLLADAKAHAASDSATSKSDEGGLGGRDLFSLLVKANTASGPGEERLSDADVLSQVPTFLLAGHETTSTATTWALFALTQNPGAQAKLRAEVRALGTDTPDMDELNSLRYLDAVVRETMRLHAPVPSSVREATKDDVIPLSEPFVDRHGVTQHNIKIAKGDSIFLPLLAINRDPAIWGEDARTFRPERWAAIPEAAAKIPGVWGNSMSFLAGPRACIGYRFSIVEMKALLYTLVGAFEFELAVPVADIRSKQSLVSRPIVLSEPDAGAQMPLLVRAYRG